MSKQSQFLEVIDRDEAERRFRGAFALAPLGEETIPLDKALGRVLSTAVIAQVDVPSFDRSNYDGFAIRAADSFGAEEQSPRRLKLLGPPLAAGDVPSIEVTPQTAVPIATGGMMPRGADAVMMIEHTDLEDSDGAQQIVLRRAVSPGFGVAFAGTDIARGETVMRQGDLLTSRETGVLAAIGVDRVTVYRRPRVAILSTGDELIAPGEPMRPAKVFDSNAQILADAVRELGALPMPLGMVRDDLDLLRAKLQEGLESADVVLLSGGTSKGEGDLSYRAVSELSDPGIVAHGVALKPGKPICLAASEGKPVVILPGFPTSAIFTFHEFVAPVISQLGGRHVVASPPISAKLAAKVNSEIGRTEYVLVGLVETNDPGSNAERAAYPMGKGSGSVTAFSCADGFIRVDRYTEMVEQETEVEVQLLGRDLEIADLVVIGSHCVGLDYLLGELQQSGYRTKVLSVGSTAGLEAAKRGECDLAGVHLLDPKSNDYNVPFLTDELERLEGYRRNQGVLFRPGDDRFEGRSAAEAIALVQADPECRMINRNQGSGTRILLDQTLRGVAKSEAATNQTSATKSRASSNEADLVQPAGYAVQPRSHSAVATAIVQGRADWGVAIEIVARQHGLGFLPLQEEQYDFIAPRSRRNRPAVMAFAELLKQPETRRRLEQLGCLCDSDCSS